MLTFGIDISKSKGQAWALCSREIIIASGIEASLSLALKHIPNNNVMVVWEKPYLGKNPASTIALSEVAGSLKAICEISDYPFQVIPGAHWQAPLKKVFGLNGKPPLMSDHQWNKLKYTKFRLYVHRFLAPAINLKNLSDDEIAACCIALHVARKERTRRMFAAVTRSKA